MERRGTDSTERTVGRAHLTGAAISLRGLVIDECCMTELAIWKTVVDLWFDAAI